MRVASVLLSLVALAVGSTESRRRSSSSGSPKRLRATLDRQQSQQATSYKYRSYSEIVDTILALEDKYPQFVEVFTAQDKYGLPIQDELQCTRKGKQEPCLHYVIKITDEASLPDPSRPEVFLSGALHGDERVGPQAVTTLAELLVDHASRSDGNAWIKRLVKTRTVVIMPTTNPQGYDHNNRTELSIDPNRDFPYLKNGTCFETMTARAVNEVWRDHLFQLAITFHGGTQSISYEWGTPNHELAGGGSQKSPDHQAQHYVGLSLSRYGAAFEDSKEYYPVGSMNDAVYAVDGGMEDWAYAASWENKYTTPQPICVCEPETFGGYAGSKSVYNSATHRAFNILIETSDSKEPTEAELGNSAALSDDALAGYLPSGQTIGHVPRNVRAALLLIEAVQPYVVWKNAPPQSSAGDLVNFKWEVMGAYTVDNTSLLMSKSADFEDAKRTDSLSGVTRWYHSDMGTSDSTNNGIFSSSVRFSTPGVYYIRAVATVDQDWQEQGAGGNRPVPNVRPQTHVVNARTNPDWSYSNNGKVVKGQLEWKSPVIKVTVE